LVKKIDKSLAKLFKLVMFSKDSSTEKYFPGLLKLVSKLEEGEEEKKNRNLRSIIKFSSKERKCKKRVVRYIFPSRIYL